PGVDHTLDLRNGLPDCSHRLACLRLVAAAPACAALSTGVPQILAGSIGRPRIGIWPNRPELLVTHVFQTCDRMSESPAWRLLVASGAPLALRWRFQPIHGARRRGACSECRGDLVR